MCKLTQWIFVRCGSASGCRVSLTVALALLLAVHVQFDQLVEDDPHANFRIHGKLYRVCWHMPCTMRVQALTSWPRVYRGPS